MSKNSTTQMVALVRGTWKAKKAEAQRIAARIGEEVAKRAPDALRSLLASNDELEVVGEDGHLYFAVISGWMMVDDDSKIEVVVSLHDESRRLTYFLVDGQSGCPLLIKVALPLPLTIGATGTRPCYSVAAAKEALADRKTSQTCIGAVRQFLTPPLCQAKQATARRIVH